MRKGQNRAPDYLKLNPLHKVPVLVVDGKPLTENVAIQLWIARHYPQAKVLPADPWDQLKAVSILSLCASGIHPFLVRINNPPQVVRRCRHRGGGEALRRRDARREIRHRRSGARRARMVLRSFHRAATRISSGAFAAARNSICRWASSRTAPRITRACSSGRACRSCSLSRKRPRRNSPPRREAHAKLALAEASQVIERGVRRRGAIPSSSPLPLTVNCSAALDTVMPAKAGIQEERLSEALDPRVRGGDAARAVRHFGRNASV